VSRASTGILNGSCTVSGRRAQVGKRVHQQGILEIGRSRTSAQPDSRYRGGASTRSPRRRGVCEPRGLEVMPRAMVRAARRRGVALQVLPVLLLGDPIHTRRPILAKRGGDRSAARTSKCKRCRSHCSAWRSCSSCCPICEVQRLCLELGAGSHHLFERIMYGISRQPHRALPTRKPMLPTEARASPTRKQALPNGPDDLPTSNDSLPTDIDGLTTDIDGLPITRDVEPMRTGAGAERGRRRS